MGLFDWLAGKRREHERGHGVPAGVVREVRPETIALPKGVKVTELPADMVSLTHEGGAVELMDRDTFDYRYTESSLPDPSQRDLTDLLGRSSRVRVLSAGVARGSAIRAPVLLDTTDPALLEALGECLVISEDPQSFDHCSCRGGPTLQFFSAGGHLANIALQHGHAIRWNAWRHDAMLRDGARLTAWLARSGVFPPLLEKLYQNPLPFSGTPDADATATPLTSAGQQLLLARIMLLRREHVDALRECDAVLAGQSMLGEAHEMRAMVRQGQGDQEASLADWGSAVALLAGDARARALSRRGHVFLELDRCGEALEDFTQSIALMASNPGALNARGLVHLAFGRLELAQSDLDAACMLAPDWTTPVCNRAFLALHRSDWAAAIAESTHAIDAIRVPSPTGPPGGRDALAKVYWYRSIALEQVGERERAAADRREAAGLDAELETRRWLPPKYRS